MTGPQPTHILEEANMLTATIMAEIAGREVVIQYPLDIEQYQRRGRYLHAVQWHRSFKGVAAGLYRALCVGTCYAWRALHMGYSAIARERERSAYRSALQALNAATLKDIGLHRSEIPWALNGLSTTSKLSRLSAWSVRH
jgi:uncharacterized protein YjiS (DUF1127 family)